MSFEGPPYLPLRLVEEQLDTLEGLSLRRPAVAFHKQLDPSHLSKLDARIGALLDGLRLRQEEALREVTLRMASPNRAECFAATCALLHLDPARVVDARGMLAIRPRRLEVVGPALRGAPCEVALVLSPQEPAGLEARARHQVLAAADLLPHLEPSAPTVLVALRAAVHLTSSDEILARCLRLAFGDAQPRQPGATVAHALFALGCAFAKSKEREAFPALVDAVLGDALFEHPFGVRVMALFGNAVTARRLAARVRREGPTPELAFCLGVLGVPEQTPVLARMVERGPEPVAHEAMRALHTMSGVWAVRSASRALRDDGKGVVPDAALARALVDQLAMAGTTRCHLGRPLEQPPERHAPASLHWLHGIALGDSRAAIEVPEGLLALRSRPAALWELGPPQDEPGAT